MTTQLVVSAVVVSCNQARWLPTALASVSSQSRPPDQVVIIDDGSVDGSHELIRSWAARQRPDAVLILRSDNRGVTRTLNEAFGRVVGDVIAPLAADDLWLPHKLFVQSAQWAQLSGDVAALYGDVACIDEDGEPAADSFITTYKGRLILPDGNLFAELLRGNFLPSPSLLLRTAAWRAVGGFDESLYMEDWDFWLRVARRYVFAVTPQPVGCYRVVGTSHVRRVGPEVLRSHLRTLTKWSEATELAQVGGVDVVRELAAQLYRSAGWGPERLRMLKVWLAHGGWSQLMRGHWPG